MKQETTVQLAGGKSISIETGKLAKQAHGSVVIRIGDNVVSPLLVPIRNRVKDRLLPLTLTTASTPMPADASPADSSSVKAVQRARDSRLPHDRPSHPSALPGDIPE